MSWEDKKSVNRIVSTFKRLKTQIFKQDVDAIKHLSELVDSLDKKVSIDNKLFLKALTLLIIERYSKNQGVNFTLKTIEKDLLQSQNYHSEILKIKINAIEFKKVIDALEVKLTESEIVELENASVDQLEHFENRVFTDNYLEVVSNIKKTWTSKHIETSLYRSANTFIQNIDNYA